MCDCALARSRRSAAGHANRRGSRLAAPLSIIRGVPAATRTPPTVVVCVVSRKSVFTGLSTRSTSSRKSGILLRSSRSWSCISGCSARCLSAAARSRAVVSWPAAKRSEEHTSELQSLMRISYAVFWLKKKKKREIVEKEITKKHNKKNRKDMTKNKKRRKHIYISVIDRNA